MHTGCTLYLYIIMSVYKRCKSFFFLILGIIININYKLSINKKLAPALLHLINYENNGK